MAGLATLPKDSEPLIDPRTRGVSRPWKRFFLDTRIQIIGIDTTVVGPHLVDLSKLDGGLIAIKDEGGAASTNPITITGTVETIVDPQITTDYGAVLIYAHNGLWFFLINF